MGESYLTAEMQLVYSTDCLYLRNFDTVSRMLHKVTYLSVRSWFVFWFSIPSRRPVALQSLKNPVSLSLSYIYIYIYI